MDQIFSTIMTDLVTPVLLIIISTGLFIAKEYAQRITESITEKNELDKLERRFAIKKHILEEMQVLVKSAVASNMQLAESLKSNGKQLSYDDSKTLFNSAKEMILFALPNSVTEANGSLVDIIGGKDVLDRIISAMIEKEVYEYKLKTSQNSNHKDTVELLTRSSIKK